MTSTVAPISENIEGGVPTSVTEKQLSDAQEKGVRVPKRILHFSDGTLEEFSSDEEYDIEPSCKERTINHLNAINPGTLAWIPWIFYKTSIAGNKALAVCDFFGEYLANFFGIITPKYDYEIEHYKRMIEEEKERQKQDVEVGGWTQAKTDIIMSEQLRNIERLFDEIQLQYSYQKLTNELAEFGE